jgi:hypothetical protein
MRLATLTRVTVLLGTGFLLAAAAQAADEKGAPLDDAKCQAAWTMASPNGDTLSKDQVVPYVLNYTMVDTDGDGKVTADEFKSGCGAGYVKDSSTVKDMKN